MRGRNALAAAGLLLAAAAASAAEAPPEAGNFEEEWRRLLAGVTRQQRLSLFRSLQKEKPEAAYVKLKAELANRKDKKSFVCALQVAPGYRSDDAKQTEGLVDAVEAVALGLEYDADARIAAVHSYALMLQKDGIPGLQIVAREDPASLPSQKALWYLLRFGDTEIVDDILGGKVRVSGRSEKILLAEVLGKLGGAKARKMLEAMWKSESSLVKAEVLAALAEVKGAAALPLLHESVTSADRSIAAKAALALGRIKDPSSIDVLAKGLDHKISSVRNSVAFALGQFTDRRVIPVLAEAVADEDEKVRKTAQYWLKKLTGLSLTFSREEAPDGKRTLFKRRTPEQERAAWLLWWKENRGEKEK